MRQGLIDDQVRSIPQLYLGQSFDPAHEGRELATHQRSFSNRLDQICSAPAIPRRESVLDRFVHESMLLIPHAGAVMQDRSDLWLRKEQPLAEQVCKKAVVTKPLPPVVEWNDE